MSEHLTPETRAEWREDAEYDVLANGDGGRTPEYTVDARRILALLDALDDAEREHRDLTSRLGFGDNITEPQADNDTIVAWFEQQSRDANEWRESQLWRGDCYAAGHPDDADCYEHDPVLRLNKAERERDEAREALARVEALADEWKALGYGASVYESAAELGDLLSAALAGPNPTDTEGDDR